MKQERYFQYTSQWHRVPAPLHHADEMTVWCQDNGTDGSFHVNYYDHAPNPSVFNHLLYRRMEMRFEHEQDAVLFKLTWCEDAKA